MQRRVFSGAVLAVVLAAPSAWAEDPHKVVPGLGGIGLDVSVDAGAGLIRTKRCKGGACNEATKDLTIGMDRSRIDPSKVSIDVLPIGDGKSVAHVRVPDPQRRDLAYEAIFSPEKDEPLFSGLTGYTSGSDGDRRGQVVLVYDRDESSKFVILAESREDTRICGQAATPLGSRGLDPKTLTWRGATLHRIDKKVRDGAEKITAKQRPDDAKAPLARLLVATGGSSAGAASLTDGKVESGWSEQRPGDGHGEFVTMLAPSEAPIHGFVVTVTPKPAPEGGAAPRTFFLATDERLFQITMPDDAWQKPGASFEIALPKPVKTTCVALVLDEAFERGKAPPNVTVAEMTALTKFDADGASLEGVAKALGSDRADEAAAVLRRAGSEGLVATAGIFGSLDDKGRALAVDVAASTGKCEGPAMELVTRALADKDIEVRRRGLGRIERCGKASAAALASAVRSEDEGRRAASAPLLAAISPSTALEPLAEQMGKGSPDTRRAVRSAFARAATSSNRDKLLGLLAKSNAEAGARLDLLRAMGAKLPDLRPESDAAIADVLRVSPDMPTRYLLAQPLAHLARSPEATSGELSRLADLVKRDPEWAVRARAVEVSAGIAPMLPVTLEAAADPQPRVREAALKALGSMHSSAGKGAAATALAADEWPFVRVAAAEALGAMPEEAAVTKPLAKALEDKSSRVRQAALTSLGKLRATSEASRIRDRLDDTGEDTEVRALAARTLGTMCIQGAADRLTKLAMLSRVPVDERDERIGMAAIEALGALHPADLEKRFAPLRDKGVRMPVRRAAERALTEPGSCR